MSGIDSLMAAMSGALEGGRSSQHKEPIPESELRGTLIAWAERYGKVPFSPGDLVTPRERSMLKGVGKPHIVLEVRPDAEPNFRGSHSNDHTSPNFGARLNMRIGCEMAGDLCAYWVEAHDFEPWVEQRAE